ncbi:MULTISPECIES: hypothetical protein [unclassified Pseudoalteromonas]|jgi:hypothetical protein|uniref:hypothetical protein n=1 Tax=unclassified Pseudoalteromonas TaxID=194690 RepID=UPI001E353B59|nr:MULTISPECIES: hypothetical protein [unclassified Pseudoalteromonas]MCC9662128.1 hypothetical protein [Pseudoalteromonas sp. MB41]MCO7208614.1 hypothetical protein [Pseudoalteromonas sp. CnMc7-37]
MEGLNKKDLDHTHIESGDDHFVLWAELDSDSPEKQVIRGTDLYNRVINKTGVVIDASNKKAIKVKTVLGNDTWSLVDCDIIESN